jgi:hypothetical protein
MSAKPALVGMLAGASLVRSAAHGGRQPVLVDPEIPPKVSARDATWGATRTPRLELVLVGNIDANGSADWLIWLSTKRRAATTAATKRPSSMSDGKGLARPSALILVLRRIRPAHTGRDPRAAPGGDVALRPDARAEARRHRVSAIRSP